MAGFYLGVAKGGFLAVSSSVDLAAQLVDHQKLILLCVNYLCFSIVVTMFLLFLMCISQISSIALDTYSTLGLMAFCFITMDLVLANYVVDTINMKKEMKMEYFNYY